jgi:gamma-glutamyl hercynylcysteine S-oxide hydrolase
MCRHLAYLGDPVSLRELVIEPPSGLYRQSWAPRDQRHGTVNADGFGVGWYADGDPVPARYRRSGPIWADPCFADLARVTRSTTVLAAVRSATEGTAAGAEAAAPYGADQWLFSLNGMIEGWPGSVAGLAAGLDPAELLSLEARCDAALVWALVLHQLRDGAGLAEALGSVVTAIAARTPARLNLLLTDGSVIAATVWGDVLGYRLGATGVLVASEAPDDEPGWTPLPDRTLVRATRIGVELRPLSVPAPIPIPPSVPVPVPVPDSGVDPLDAKSADSSRVTMNSTYAHPLNGKSASARHPAPDQLTTSAAPAPNQPSPGRTNER